ncbi:MAG: hypothetical protein EOP48_02520 [Sphingobacteriales bacterium]|nr:MAG: hypothetical protein EOP48_02520 [Sphingobacteriales bacterium]
MKQYTMADVQIDVADIWRYEQEHLKSQKATSSEFHELRQSLIPFYIQNKHEPFVSKIGSQDDASLKSYYDNYTRRLRHDNPEDIDYFKCCDAFYDLNESCVIRRGEVIPHMFTWLFAHKLRQLNDEDKQIKWFLGFHYHESFHGDENEFKAILSSLQLYKAVFTPAMSSTLEQIAANLESLPGKEVYVDYFNRSAPQELPSTLNDSSPSEDATPDEAQRDNKERSPVESNASLNVNEDIVHEELATAIEIPNEGKWSREEINHYFSFLYQSRGEGEGSYLTKEEVETIFKDGITIPARPLAEKFKLAWTPRYSKKLVEYFLYQFIQHYNFKEKKSILIFFGNYIEDFAQALHPKALQNLNKNITGDKPSKLFFKVEDFLPKRFQ